jgi:hypothetical protein
MLLARRLRPAFAALTLAAALTSIGRSGTSLYAQAPVPAAAEAPAAPDAQEAFLTKAEVVSARQLGKGVTNPWRLTLEQDGVRHDAAFQAVDRTKDEVTFRSGRTERDFRDFYGYNIAAYKLARLLGYDDLVPASIERVWKGRRGALTWWVNKKWDEDERQKAGVTPPDMAAWERQLYLARAFTQLVDDSDRNLGNQLVTADFRLWLIDFTRAFRHTPGVRNPTLLRRIDRRFFERLKAVTDEELIEAVSHWLERPARDALLSRRAAMVKHFEALVAQRGDAAQVFYETPTETARSKENP